MQFDQLPPKNPQHVRLWIAVDSPTNFIYESLEDLQSDLDDWMKYYNNARLTKEKCIVGQLPLQTLLDGKTIWQQKVDTLNLN